MRGFYLGFWYKVETGMNAKNAKWRGVVAPIVTPVRADGGIDHEGLARLARWLVAQGVDGIFVAGTTGRFCDFTPAENAQACRTVADAVGESTTIYGGISDSGARRMLSNAEQMREAGADVLVTTGPYYLRRSVEEAEHDLMHVANHSPLPVIFYNIPEFVGYGLRPEWIAAMADHPNVAGYKDSSNDLDHHLDVLRRTHGKNFAVFIGKEMLITPALKAGSTGLLVSLLNFAPKPFVELMRAAEKGDWAAAEVHQQAVNNLFTVVKGKFEERPVFSTLMRHIEGELRRQGVDCTLQANDTNGSEAIT